MHQPCSWWLSDKEWKWKDSKCHDTYSKGFETWEESISLSASSMEVSLFSGGRHILGMLSFPLVGVAEKNVETVIICWYQVISAI